MICFVIPGDPVALGRARVTTIGGKARMYTPGASVTAKNATALYALAAGVRPLEDAVGLDVVSVWAWPKSWSKRALEAAVLSQAMDHHMGIPKTSRPDADNCGKLVGDALNGIAYADDSQVWQMRAIKIYGPRAETHVRLWQGSEPPRMERWWR